LRKYHSAGFGLIDLLILLSISSIILALSVPQISAFSQAGILRHETRRLESTIKSLTIASLQHRESLALTLYPDRYTIYYPSAVSPLPSVNHQLHRSVSIDLGSHDKREIVFYQSGVNSPSSINLLGKHQSCTVVLSLRGRVRSEC